LSNEPGSKKAAIPGFTQRYGVHQSVWFVSHPTMESAIKREKCIKEWKLDLIEKDNPEWVDLYTAITGQYSTVK
jgi:putative endonuclease